MGACDTCMRRTWLLGRVSGYLQFQRRQIEDMLSLTDEDLIALWSQRVDDRVAAEYRDFDRSQAEAERAQAKAAGLELICVCDAVYPASLRRLRTPPAVLHVAGGMQRFLELAAADPVAIVGSRRATEYGQEVARMLGRGLSASGLCVVSGLAPGVDAAAHSGSLAAGGRTIAVMAGSAAEPHPKAHRQLHRKILNTGAAVSELGPHTSRRAWTFVARNRIIAGLSRLTIVVQAAQKSGALITAEFACRTGVVLGAVPGLVGARQSYGPNKLLAAGAVVIRDAQDALNAVFGADVREAASADRSVLDAGQLELVDAIASGVDTAAALAGAGLGGGELLVMLAELELSGCVRRATGGRYVAIA